MPNFKIFVNEMNYFHNNLIINLQALNCMPNNCSISKIYLDVDDKTIEADTDGENYSTVKFKDLYLREYESETFKITFEMPELENNKNCKIRFVTPMGNVSFDLKISF